MIRLDVDLARRRGSTSTTAIAAIDDREQRQQPEDPPGTGASVEWRGLGTGSGSGTASLWPREVGLSSRQAASLGGDGHDHRSSASRQGQRGRDDRRRRDRWSTRSRRLGEKRIGALPVVEDGRIAGIISERDVIYCLRDHGAEVLDWPVARVMSSPAITVDPDTDVLAALALMTQRRIRHLPVVEGGEIRGIVSIGDLVKHRMERIEAEAEAMRDYIQSA